MRGLCVRVKATPARVAPTARTPAEPARRGGSPTHRRTPQQALPVGLDQSNRGELGGATGHPAPDNDSSEVNGTGRRPRQAQHPQPFRRSSADSHHRLPAFTLPPPRQLTACHRRAGGGAAPGPMHLHGCSGPGNATEARQPQTPVFGLPADQVQPQFSHRFAGPSLRPEKGRGAATSPTHHQALRKPAAAAGWTLTGSCLRIYQRSPLPSSGREKAEAGSPAPSLPAFECRWPPPATGLCPAESSFTVLAPRGQRPPQPARPSQAAVWLKLENTGRRTVPSDRKRARAPGKAPPQRPPSAPLRRLSRRPCSRSSALLRAPVTTSSHSTGKHVRAPGRLQECRTSPPGRPANDTGFYDDVTGGSARQRPLRQLRGSGGAIRSTSQPPKCG